MPCFCISRCTRCLPTRIPRARHLRTKTAVLHLLGSYLWLAAGAFQGSSSMLSDPVAQRLLNHSQAAGCRRLALARLNKPRRLLLELKRVTSPLRLRHLRYPFALEQLAKGYVLRGQAHTDPDCRTEHWLILGLGAVA